MQHFPTLWPGNFWVDKQQIDQVMPLKTTVSASYDSSCILITIIAVRDSYICDITCGDLLWFFLS